jgi:hypothetical protein
VRKLACALFSGSLLPRHGIAKIHRLGIHKIR